MELGVPHRTASDWIKKARAAGRLNGMSTSSAARRMGSVQPYKTNAGKRYLVRYKKPDNTHAAKRGFRTKREAEDYLATVTSRSAVQQYINPNDARITIAELGDMWLQDQAAVLKPSSMHPLGSAWRVHVEPRWGTRASDVRYSDVRAG